VVIPNIRWFGSVIWWSEFFIFASLFLGLFSRVGGLVALGVSAQLTLGLAGISIPGDYEWEWAYLLMVTLAIMMIGLTPGRIFGIDALIRRALKPSADRGNLLAKLVLLGT
jgi:TQO small subunit DoxD